MKTIIRQLLDDTDFYSRAEWSQFLGISESALMVWTTTDAMIPRADLLHMVIDLLKTRGGSSARPALAALDEAIQADPDLRAYYGASSLADLGRSLRDESVLEQIAILRDGRVHKQFATDVIGNAVKVMRIATSEESDDREDTRALTPGQHLGKLGGAARARNLTAEQRQGIAKKAAAKRWEKP